MFNHVESWECDVASRNMTAELQLGKDPMTTTTSLPRILLMALAAALAMAMAVAMFTIGSMSAAAAQDDESTTTMADDESTTTVADDESTTTTAEDSDEGDAPAGGADTGAGGTAEDNTTVLLLIGLGALALGSGAYVVSRSRA